MKDRTLPLLFLFFFIFLSTSWARGDLTLEEIRKAIKEKGAKWEAGETWIFRLSPEERKKFLGDLPVKYPGVEMITQPLSGAVLPDSFDWRNNSGENWTTSIKDQSACGNCWAYASCGALETVVRITLNEPDLYIDLSELYLTSCSGRGCDPGWDQSSTLQFIKSRGVPDQGCFPGYLPPQPCADTCDDKYLRSIFIENWYHDGFGFIVDPEDVNVIKERIVNYGPVTVHFEVFGDFSGYRRGVYKHVSGDSEGWHAVSFVGWNDADSCWIAKNSWGTGWGEDGWFRIEMMDAGVQIDEEIWYLTVNPASIPRIRVTVPDQEDRWLVGMSEKIRWSSPYFIGYVKIEYSTNGGSTWSTVADSTFDDGSLTWSHIPDTPSQNCKIKVSDVVDGNPYDVTDSTFYIIPLGDANCDVNVNIVDVVYLVNYVFKSGPEPCILKAGNANCDLLGVTVEDIVFLVNYVFKGGSKPEC